MTNKLLIDYSKLKFNHKVEEIVTAIANKVGRKDKSFFRIQLHYYICAMAGMCRTSIQLPGNSPQIVNMFGINLAPSGFGKGFSTSLIENELISDFREDFINRAFLVCAEKNFPTVAASRASKNSIEFDDAMLQVQKEFTNLGPLDFSYDSGTAPATKQLRIKLLMAKAGAINVQTDEIGIHLSSLRELLSTCLELYDGSIKPKLVKNTNDNSRIESLHGKTPCNLLLFGEPTALLDGGSTEDQFIQFLTTGFARRSLFGFVPANYKERYQPISAQERLNIAKQGNDNAILSKYKKEFSRLSSELLIGKTVNVPDDVALLYFDYDTDCHTRAHELKEHEFLHKASLMHSSDKALRIAGAYAFIDQVPEVTIDHLESAICLLESSNLAFKKLLTRERSYVRLAKYLADSEMEKTLTDLAEELPAFKGTKQQKEDLLTQAISWGYKNNILIRRSYSSGVDFVYGKKLSSTNINAIKIAYSKDITEDYKNEVVPFTKLHQLTQQPNMHFINHHLENGYRSNDNCIKGFNLLCLDVDNGLPISLAKDMLKEYNFLLYTTKRHDVNNNRYRLLIPTNFELELTEDDYEQFMKNLYEWLPFNSDEQTNQRSRKWLTCSGHYEYNQGKLLDILPFIPRTAKNEERQQNFIPYENLSALERWFILNTPVGNRNNQLLKYALALVDMGLDEKNIHSRVFELNEKLEDSISQSRIIKTIFQTVSKKIKTK